jgi:hypothetical protein
VPLELFGYAAGLSLLADKFTKNLRQAILEVEHGRIEHNEVVSLIAVFRICSPDPSAILEINEGKGVDVHEVADRLVSTDSE